MLRERLNRLALWWLKRQFQRDANYAWTWHCAIAMCMSDEGASDVSANWAASRAMRMLFGVKTDETENFRRISLKWPFGEHANER
jgi:hypothetical protein